MTHVLLGGGGVLGSGFRAVLDRQGAVVHRVTPRWAEPGMAVDLERQLTVLLSEPGTVTLLWAAGVGYVGASAALVSSETDGVQALCRVVRGLPAERRSQVSVVFASSAGALFGGFGTQEVDEDSVPHPVTAYGEHKLAQEHALERTALDSGCRVLVCRITNLYGLAGGHLTARGLVSTAVRATRLRQPMVVFVSPDTRRDYVYNEDAAAVALRQLEHAPPGLSRLLVRDGTTRSVAEVLALVGAVSGRRVPASYAERPETRLQPRVLRFRRPPQGPDQVRRMPMETAVHRMLRAPMAG